MALVLNQRDFSVGLMREFSESIRAERPLALVMFAIVGFEHADDPPLGPVMREALDLVRPQLGEADLLTHRDDELLVLAPGLPRPKAQQLATTIRDTLERHRFEPGHRSPGICLSVTMLEPWHGSGDQLLQEGDRRLFRARGLGPGGEVTDFGDECVIIRPHEPHGIRRRHRTACLVVIRGPQLGRKYDLDGRELTIGRASINDVHTEHESVSEVHATITLDEQGVRLRDVSTSGTYVNDRLIEDTYLHDGDLIRIGHSIFKFLSGDDLENTYHEEIYRLSTLDRLTEVFNRRFFDDTLDREVKRAHRYERPLSIVLLDIDVFHYVNDTFGRDAGDQVLRSIAELLRDRSRKVDVVARLEGDVFGVILPEKDRDQAASFAEDLRAAIEPHEEPIIAALLTASFGVAELRPGHDASALHELAAERLRRAKQHGRNRVVASDDPPPEPT